MSEGAVNIYAVNTERALEQWLLDTGKQHLNPDVLRIVEREMGT